MASATPSTFLSSYCFQRSQCRARCRIRYRIGGGLTTPSLFSLSICHLNHVEYLRVARLPTIVCTRDSKIAEVTWKSWDELVLKNKSPVLVFFYASWCGPCQMVHRVIDEISVEYRGIIDCFLLETDSDMVVADEYDIKAVPVVLLFKNGKKCDSIIGTMPKEFYVDAIDKVLAS